jgi:hypothetical protein
MLKALFGLDGGRKGRLLGIPLMQVLFLNWDGVSKAYVFDTFHCGSRLRDD